MNREATEVREVSPGYGLTAATPAVPIGYKQTEVGVIPEDWEVLQLSDIFEFRNGVNADRKSYGQGIRFINVLEPITYSHIYGPEITGKVTLPEAVAVPYSVRQGDILFNRTSETAEELGLASAYLGVERVVFGGFVIRGRPVGEKLDAKYAGYALRAPYVRKQIIPMGQGAIRTNIGQKNLGRVVAPVPPLSEQRGIATALSDVDALLKELDRLIAKKRNIKQATMQQLLTGQTRLPGFEGEWHLGMLGDVIANLDAGVSVNSTDESPADGRPCVLKTSAIDSGTLLISESKVIDQGDITRAKVNPKKDTLLISRMNTPNLVGEVAYVGQDYDWLFLPDRVWMACFKFELRASVKWLGYVLSSRPYRESLRDIATGTSGSMKNISKPSLLALPISFPEPSEQAAIANVISDIDIEIEALKKRRTKIAELKQAIMQELLTGRTRLIGPQNHRGSSC